MDSIGSSVTNVWGNRYARCASQRSHRFLVHSVIRTISSGASISEKPLSRRLIGEQPKRKHIGPAYKSKKRTYICSSQSSVGLRSIYSCWIASLKNWLMISNISSRSILIKSRRSLKKTCVKNWKRLIRWRRDMTR